MSRRTVQSLTAFFVFFKSRRSRKTKALSLFCRLPQYGQYGKKLKRQLACEQKGRDDHRPGPDSAVVAELPKGNSDDELRITIAYLIVAAPKLFEMCCKIKSIFENNLIVTREGFKINCSDIEKSLLDAILRARGCAKTPDEP